MTEYTAKLITEDSTAHGATRETAVDDTRLAEIGSTLVDEMAELLKLRESVLEDRRGGAQMSTRET